MAAAGMAAGGRVAAAGRGKDGGFGSGHAGELTGPGRAGVIGPTDSADPNAAKPGEPAGVAGASKICLFSKAISPRKYDELASLVAEMEFDGIDLTVRPDGHVKPGQVERDLPVAVEAARKAGVPVYMITTDITDARDRYTEPIIKTAASLGIPCYRMGRWFYDRQKSIPSNLAGFDSSRKQLSDLNRAYGIRGEWQNHSGDGFGAPVWDLWEVLKDGDPRWTGVQYDIFHAVAEGAESWPLGFKLLQPFIGTLDIKDFYWKKINGKWDFEITPLGEGMIDFKRFTRLLKENNMRGPFSIHYEYLPDTMDPAVRVEKMKKDLLTLRGWLQENGL